MVHNLLTVVDLEVVTFIASVLDASTECELQLIDSSHDFEISVKDASRITA